MQAIANRRRERGRTVRGFLLAGISLFVIGVIALKPPMDTYASTNPGLDSGNAQIDTTSVPGQTILKYRTTGNSVFKAPAGVTSVRVLVIGGGGAGGSDNAGGGGAGGFVENTNFAVTPGAAVTVTVGTGGTSQATKAKGGNGTNSVFGSLTAVGGGGGGWHSDPTGNNGGSGGGAGGAGTASGGTATSGQGNNGGAISGSVGYGRTAGGGGAGAVGGNGTAGAPGAGGAGKSSDITGSSVFYAGGGGGAGRDTVSGSAGGSGGGGRGAGANGPAAAGSANTGSGGGGGSYNGDTGNLTPGGYGGTGTVIVRFATQNKPDAMGMTGVRMWYKADGAGNTNALWKDSSGLGFDITQGTVAKQPVLTQGQINFNPAYVFDGTDDAFSMPTHGIIGTDPMTAFYGATASRTDGGYRYFEEFGDDTPSISMNNGKPDLYVRGTSPLQLTYPTVEALIPHVYSFVSPNANNQPRIVGVDSREQSQNVTSGVYTTTSGGQAGNMFGRTNGSSGTSWAGPIAEAIYFNRVLTAQERQQINSYLAIKYGATLGTGATAYLASNGTPVYPADATYKNNIAGIGRDDTTTLNQKQSKSTADGDIVTAGLGTIAATNQANSNTFGADRSFLIWGHNGAATNATTTVTGAYVRMNRIWKAVNTNSVGQIKIQVPSSAMPGGDGVLYTSSSATFDAGSTRTAMTLNGANYEATITLPAGTSYFTFGSQVGSDIQFVSKTATDIGGTTITSYTPGESIEYKLTVKNNGPDNSGVVTVTDTLPTGVVPKVGGATGGGWNCNVNLQTVTCTRPVLNSGATAPDITIEANIASNVTGTKANTATASVSNDPDLSNNSQSVTLPAAPKADLSIAKSHTGIPTAGQPHTYKFTVTNNGPSDVASFTVTDVLDSNLQLASSTGNICSPVGGAFGQTITCTGGAITANGAGSTVSFDMVVNVAGSYAGGTISNTGTVAPPTGTIDSVTSNNSSTDQSNVLVDTQLGIVKSHTGNFTAGVNNSFTLTVDNQGPSNASIGSVTVTDVLDEDFTYVPTANTGWNCSESGGTVTCTNTAAINSGDTTPITLTVLVDPIADGSTTNTAEVSSTTPDSDLSDNTSTDTVTIVSEADLGITKAHVGTGFVAGEQGQYTFTVVNNGPSADSPSYTITDTLPTGFTYASSSGAADCSTSSGTNVVCTGGAIGAGDPAQVTTITVNVSGSATGTIGNTATVAPAPGTTDPVSGNNTSTDNVDIEPNADLSIAKTPSADMTAGDTEQYTIKVHNNGPSNVSSFTVTDTLDSNLTFQPSTGCTHSSTTGDGRQVITCTGGAVNSGQDAPDITINVLVESTVAPGSTISNTATVAPPASVNDPTPGNNTSSVDRNIVTSADLAITKTHTGNFTAGTDTNTYTIAVTNNGPSDATTFTVSDTLPTGLTFVSSTSTGISASCTSAGGGQIVTCTGGPTIGTGETSTITLTVAAGAGLAGNTTLDNTASVASATPDPNSANNTTPTDTATIDSKADLGITKSNATDFTAGNNEDYLIEVTNAGPSDADGFTVTDTLPAGLTYVSSAPGDPCAGSSGVNVTCTITDTLPGNNGSTAFTITVAVSPSLTAGTNVANTATVATIAPTTDPNNANNSSTDNTNVVDVTDLSITKGHTGTFVAGEQGQYTFTVNNAGPSTAAANDVQVTDTLPEGMSFASGGGTGGWDSCVGSSGRTVVCTYTSTLAAAATTPTLTVTVSIDANTQGEVTNTGVVVSTLDDSDPADDQDSDTTTIVAEADLTASKTPQGSLTAGQDVTYRFEVENNSGPSTANNVKITDNLQGHFIYQGFTSVSGGSWNCSEASGTVTCDLSSLAIGDTAVVDVTLKVAEDAPNPVTNTAAVTFDGTDPSPANPSTTDPVTQSADLEVDITHEQKTYRAGDTVNYTITAKNHGPSAAKDAVLTVTIPDGLTVEQVSGTAPGGGSILSAIDRALFPTAGAASNPFGCSLTGNKLVCTASTLFVGTYNTFLTAKIKNNYTGQIVLTAHITSSTPDPNPNDTTATDILLDVLPSTGQNIWLWIGGAGTLIVAAALISVYIWRRKSHSSQLI